jgi:hypothetical protein
MTEPESRNPSDERKPLTELTAHLPWRWFVEVLHAVRERFVPDLDLEAHADARDDLLDSRREGDV